MKIAFIIVRTEKTPARLVTALVKEIKALKRRNGSVLVVTNKSGAEGYAAGVNKGLREARKDGCDVCVIMNPDISIKCMTGADIVAPGMVYDIWGYAMKQDKTMYYGGELDRWRLSAGLRRAKPQGRYADVPYVSGSFMCLKREVVEKIGMLDEGFFMYYEDVDYCRRALKKGFKVGIDSEVMYTHFETSRGYPEKTKWLARSRIRYFIKYANQLQQLYELVRLPKTLFEYRGLFLEELKKRPFLTNFLSLNMSSALNKVLTFLLFIVLVRTLDAADYGLYSLAWAHIGITMPLADFGTTSHGIIRYSGRNFSDYNSMFTLRWIIGIVMIFMTILLAYILRYDAATVSLIAYLIPAMIFNIVSGSLLILSAAMSKSYISSIVSVSTNAVLIAILLIVALVKPQGAVLQTLFVSIAILYTVFTVVAYAVLRRYAPPLAIRLDAAAYRDIAKKASMFMILGFFAGLYYKADVILLNMLKGPADVGIYSSGYKFFEALIFVAASYTIAATPVFTSLLKSDTKGFMHKVWRDAALMFLLGCGIAGMLIIMAPALLAWVLHGQYAGAIPVFRTVITALPFLLASTVFMNASYLLRKTHIIIFLFVILTTVNALLNYLLIPRFSYSASAVLTVATEILSLIILAVYFSYHKNSLLLHRSKQP